MAAGLTGNRNTARYDSGVDDFIVVPVEGNTIIYCGSLVAIDHNGFAVPAQPYGSAPLDVLNVVGRMEQVVNGIPGQAAKNVVGADTVPAGDYPNTIAIGTAGAIYVVVRRSTFGWDIDSSSIAAANIGALAFAVSDHSVNLSDASAANPCAGRIVAIEGGQVFVDSRDKGATATTAGH
jgi:hypothetical protein